MMDMVGVYIRSNLIIIERNDLGIPTLHAVQCEVHHPKLSFLIACMYRPPKSLLENSIETVKLSLPRHMFRLGNLNCDICY